MTEKNLQMLAAKIVKAAGARVAKLDVVLLGNADMKSLKWRLLGKRTEPNVLSWFFHPRGVPGEGGQGKNRARYRSALAGELLDRASEAADRALRREIYRQLADTMAVDLPVVPLWHEDQVAVVSERARGFLPSAEGRWLALAGLE